MATYGSDNHRIIVESLGRYLGENLSIKKRVMIPCPFHKETMPSMSVNLDPHNRRNSVGGYYCFSGATRVMTRNGVKAIRDLSGSVHKVLTTGGKWVDAPFKSYGKQRLYRIDLTRNGVNKTVYATKEHRWILKEHKGRVAERTTETLNVGNILATVIPKTKITSDMDADAIRRGFILGDGTIDKRKQHAKAYLYADKAEFMQPYFDACVPATGHRTYRYNYDGTDSVYQGKQTVVTGFPTEFKTKLPSINSSDSYILGFLAGLIAADGCVDKSGTTSLHSSSRSLLRRVRDLATKVGISTLSITCQMRKGYGTEATPIYRVHFLRSTLPSWMLLNPVHRERFEATPPQLNYLSWRVTGIRETSRIETVYCCEVPKTYAFALEDNILTGNCFGCRASTSTHGGWNGLARLIGLPEVDGSGAQVTTHVRRSREPVEELFNPDEGMDLDRLMAQWNIDFWTPWPIEEKWRGVPGWLMHNVGAWLAFDALRETQVCVLPQWNGEILTGAIKCVVKVNGKNKRFKYLSAPGTWVKTHALFPYHVVEWMLEQRNDKTVLLVEGPRDAIRMIGCGIPALALLGTNNWTEEKRDLLLTLDPDRAVMAFDNDRAGQGAIKLVSPTLKGFVHRSRLFYEEGVKDPGCAPISLVKEWKATLRLETTSVRKLQRYDPEP